MTLNKQDNFASTIHRSKNDTSYMLMLMHISISPNLWITQNRTTQRLSPTMYICP